MSDRRSRRVLAVVALAAVFTVATTAEGQTPPLAAGVSPATTRPAIRNWTMADGLPQATITAFAQTPDGYLWLGTDAGLARFDGASFVPFTSQNTPALSIQRVRSLQVDASGALWIGIDGGHGLLRLKDGKFDTVQSGQGRKNLPCISSASDPQGRLWFGSFAGLLRSENGSISVIESVGARSVGNVYALAAQADSIWLGTDHGLWRLGDQPRTLEPVPLAEPNSQADASVTALLAEGSDKLWIGTADQGLLKWEAGRTRPVEHETGAPTRITALLKDRAGVVWVAGREGLGRVSPNGRLVARPLAGLPQDELVSLFEDRTGSLWIGTRGMGAIEVREATFAAVPLAQDRTIRAASVYGTRDGAVWIGTEGAGLFRHDQTTLSHWTTREGLCTDTIWTLTDAGDGTLWVGGSGGKTENLCRLDPKTGQVMSAPPGLDPTDWIRALYRDHTNELWIGTSYRGLFRLPEQADRISEQKLPSVGSTWKWQPVYSIHEDKTNQLWVGANHGLYRRGMNGWERFGAETGLSNPLVLSIDQGQDEIVWLGTFSGLSWWREGKFFSFNESPSVGTDPVFAVRDDGIENLWLTNSRGVFRVRKRDLLSKGVQTPAPRFVRYGRGDGLGTDRIEGGEGQAGMFRDRGGRLWIPTSVGVAVTDPARLRSGTQATPVVIERISSGDQTINPGTLIEFRPGRGQVEITYAAIRVGSSADKLRFRHRLIPFDSTWVDADDRRQVGYTNLDPGHYTFQVIAAFEDGPWTAQPTAIQFSLAPHWHQTLLFRAAALIGVLALGLGIGWRIYRNRLARIEEQHQAVLSERARMARELHDTLAQGFTGISVQLEAASRALEKAPDRVRENLDQARGLVRVSLAEARRAVWDLRMEGLEGGDIVGPLSAAARALSAQVPIRVQVNGSAQALSADRAAALVRIGQEALTNAVKHARATYIVLQISFGSHEVELKILDNGAGMPAGGPPPGHFGIRGMHERAANAGGRVEIRSEQGAGAEISVMFPYSVPALAQTLRSP